MTWSMIPERGSKNQFQITPRATGIAIHGSTKTTRKNLDPRIFRFSAKASSSARTVCSGMFSST